MEIMNMITQDGLPTSYAYALQTVWGARKENLYLDKLWTILFTPFGYLYLFLDLIVNFLAACQFPFLLKLFVKYCYLQNKLIKANII